MSRCTTKRTSGRSIPMPKAIVATTTTGSPERNRASAARFVSGIQTGMEGDRGDALLRQPLRHALGLRAAGAIDDAADAGMARQQIEQLRGLAHLRRGGDVQVRRGGSWRRRFPPAPSSARAGCRRACADRRSRSAPRAARRGTDRPGTPARDTPGGIRGPIATRNAPRRSRTAQAAAATAAPACHSPSSRSGETYSRSSCCSIRSRVVLRASAGSRSECSAPAATPSWRSAATWSSISAISGEITTAVPGRHSAGTWKQMLLPPPVGASTSASPPATTWRTTCSCWPRKPGKAEHAAQHGCRIVPGLGLHQRLQHADQRRPTLISTRRLSCEVSANCTEPWPRWRTRFGSTPSVCN